MGDAEWTEEKFRALTMHSVDIISLLDAEGRLLFNSPATLRINGFSPEELQDRETFELIHPDDRAAVAQAFAEVVATPGAILTVEYRYLTKDGRWLWMEAVASNQIDNPAVRGVVANSRDITERKRAEADRLRLEQQLQHRQKLESLGVMAGGVAHDFNNLLAIILGQTNLLQRRLGEGDARTVESLDTIETATQRAADLTRQLLAYAGHRVARLEATDLSQLILELAPLLKLSSRGVLPVRLELARGVSPVVADAGQLRQVMLNLVLNAAEALPEEGEVTVRLVERGVTREELDRGPLTAGFQPGRAVILEVVDTGAGMTPDTVSRIFDPFFSTKQTGRGLGLAAVSGIVRSHGAALGIETEPGRGSTFRLYFPPAAAAVAPSWSAPPRPSRFQGRALVVDDEPLVAETLAAVLAGLGWVCTVVTDGQQAVARFREEPLGYAVVICDILMPGLDGPSTVARLRALRPATPVLFASGYTPDPGVVVDDGQTGFLAKPFDLSSLIRALQQLVPGAEVKG